MQPQLAALGLPFQDAREPSIWGSILRLKKASGTRLFVFLSGHGVYEPSAQRLFLTQEATVGNWQNLGLNFCADYLLSCSFARQFLFMDGCQNYPYSASERQQMVAGNHNLPPATPLAGNILVACYAASQGEVAAEIDGRGAMMRQLLDGLDPLRPWVGAVDLDFSTGVRSVDLSKLMANYVIPGVTEQVAKLRIQQTPAVVPWLPVMPVYRLPDLPTARVELTVTPAEALGDLESVRLYAPDQIWEHRLPAIPRQPVALPSICKLPLGTRARAQWEVRERAGWEPSTALQRFEVSRDMPVLLSLSRGSSKAAAPAPSLTEAAGPPREPGHPDSETREPKSREPELQRPEDTRAPAYGPSEHEAYIREGPPVPGSVVIVPPFPDGPPQSGWPPYQLERDRSGFHITTRRSDGSPAYNEFNYADLFRRLPLHAPPAAGDEVAPGIEIVPHERGPDFVVQPAAFEAGAKVASRWAEIIDQLTSSDIGVTLSATGGARLSAAPNLRLSMSPEGAPGLAGPLAELPMVWMGPPASRPNQPLWQPQDENQGSRSNDRDLGQRTSLAECQRSPEWRVAPGQTLLVVDLPWGSWTKLVDAPAAGTAAVDLPAAVGRAPLRVAAWQRDGLSPGRRRQLEQEIADSAQPPRYAPLAEDGGESWIWEVGCDAPQGSVQDLRARKDAANPLQIVDGGRIASTRQGEVDLDAAIADLDGTPRVRFPLLPGRGFALDRSTGGLRVEPLSALPVPAWDLLVATGRLDALDSAAAWTLAESKWQDWLMGLAAAYGLYACSTWDRLRIVCDNVGALARKPQLDVELLLAAASLASEDRTDDIAKRLRPFAERQAVPLLRWGVGLALRLLQHTAAPGRPFKQWRRALSAIEQSLSPLSIWSAWTEEASATRPAPPS